MERRAIAIVPMKKSKGAQGKKLHQKWVGAGNRQGRRKIAGLLNFRRRQEKRAGDRSVGEETTPGERV